MSFPDDLKYTKDHEWARIEGSVVTIGITDHAQSALGDIVFVELPEIGRELKVGDTFGVVESIKAVSDLFSPVGGTVTEVNNAVVDEPQLLNKDPHHKGWIVKLELKGDSPQDLMAADAYQEYVNSL